MKPTGTVIHEVFRRAHARGDRPALINLRGGRVYGYRRLVTEITRAVSGLLRRGARRDQVHDTDLPGTTYDFSVTVATGAGETLERCQLLLLSRVDYIKRQCAKRRPRTRSSMSSELPAPSFG